RFPHPPLLPVYPVARATSRQLIHRIERDWCGHVDVILRGEEKESVLAKYRKELRENLTAVAPIFLDKPFFMNEEFTLVDCALAPILWRLPVLGLDLPAKQCKPIFDYAERMFDRDGFQASLSDKEREIRSLM
ncbi:MAG: stringent starvation protein A, partial [Gammaproteobacteria bacterium HGW-Gammaproteobacteria-14]